MKGRVFLMELKRGWKGLLIFLALMFVYHSVIMGVYGIWDSGPGAYEGQEFLTLYTDGEGNATLYWVQIPNATGYAVVKSNASYMIPATMVYGGTSNSTTFTYDKTEPFFVAVVASVGNDTMLLGMTSNEEYKDPFEEMFDNPFYQSFGGGREIRMDIIEGFVSIEMLSMLMFVGGIYLVNRASASYSNEIDGKQFDIVLSAPVSRTQYIVEKMLYHLFVTVMFCFMAFAGVFVGQLTLDLDAPIPTHILFLTFFASLPMFMVFQAAALAGSLWSKTGKGGFGLGIGLMLGSYFFTLVAMFVKSLDWVEYLAVSKYYDYNRILYDHQFPYAYTAVLLVAWLTLAGVCIWLFRRKDLAV